MKQVIAKGNTNSTEKIIDVNVDNEYRCPYCNKLFFKGKLGTGTKIEIFCRRDICKRFIRFEIL